MEPVACRPWALPERAILSKVLPVNAFAVAFDRVFPAGKYRVLNTAETFICETHARTIDDTMPDEILAGYYASVTYWTDLRADLTVNDARGKVSMILFRTASCNRLPAIVRAPVRVIYAVLVSWIFGVVLPVGTRVGPGLRLNHATGLVVNRDSVIGAYCDLKHGCTIGVRVAGGGCPVLADGVVLGAGSHVVGEITLGRDAEVGAGAVVLADVPAGHIAVGNPARIMPRRTPKANPLPEPGCI